MTNKIFGTVKFVSHDSRFAFIARDDGERDIYLGGKDLMQSGLAFPEVGDRLRFDLKKGNSGFRAVEIERAA